MTSADVCVRFAVRHIYLGISSRIASNPHLIRRKGMTIRLSCVETGLLARMKLRARLEQRKESTTAGSYCGVVLEETLERTPHRCYHLGRLS